MHKTCRGIRSRLKQDDLKHYNQVNIYTVPPVCAPKTLAPKKVYKRTEIDLAQNLEQYTIYGWLEFERQNKSE